MAIQIPALEHFEDGIAEVQDLLTLDKSESADLPAANQDNESHQRIGATIRRAAVVLLVSHFEGYLKQLGEDLVDNLSSGDIEARRLPRGLREVHTLPKLQDIVACKDDSQRLALMSRLDMVSSLWKDTAKPPRGTLRASVVARLVTNADSDCITSLFQTFGEPNDVCAGDIDVPANGDDGSFIIHNIKARLRDVVKCRNDIAHGDIDRKPTAEDVDRYISFLRQFARRLHRKAYNIIERVLEEEAP